MAAGALILGVLSLILMIGGFFTTTIPILGSILSFGSPICALAGMIMSGVAMSRAKQEGGDSALAIVGLVINILGFIGGLLVAITCGLCNACVSAGAMNAGSGAQGFGRGVSQNGNPFANNGAGGAGSAGGPLGGLAGLGAEMSRVSLGFSLAGIQASCIGDPTGASSAGSFHPNVAATLTPQACQITDQAAEAFGRSCNNNQHPCSTAQPLAGTPEAAQATALGLDLNRCYLYTSGQAKIVGCTTDTGFKIVGLQNPSAVQ